MKDNSQNNDVKPEQAPKGGDKISRDSSTHHVSEAVQAKPLEVKVFGNNFDKALKAFKALVQKEKILSSYKESKVYEKASDKKRRKRNEARRKATDPDNDLNEPTTQEGFKSRKKRVSKSN